MERNFFTRQCRVFRCGSPPSIVTGMILYKFCGPACFVGYSRHLLLVSPLPLVALTILDHVLIRIALRTGLESSFGLYIISNDSGERKTLETYRCSPWTLRDVVTLALTTTSSVRMILYMFVSYCDDSSVIARATYLRS